MLSKLPTARIPSPYLAAAFLLVLVLTGSRPACAQITAPIEVDAAEKQVIDLAASVAGNIPYIGPFIGPTASLLFGQPETPGYEQMKSEWESYTDTKLAESRRNLLVDGHDGVRENLKQVNRLLPSDPVEGYAELKRVQSRLVHEIGGLKSNPGEPTGPSIFYYGAAVNLHLDVLKELVERAENENEKLTWVNEYNHFLSFYGTNLNQEFIKGAAERVDKVEVYRNNPGWSLSLAGKAIIFKNGTFKEFDPETDTIPIPRGQFRSWGMTEDQRDAFLVKVANDFYNVNAKLFGTVSARFDWLLEQPEGHRRPTATTGPKSPYNPGPDVGNIWTRRRYMGSDGSSANWQQVVEGLVEYDPSLWE